MLVKELPIPVLVKEIGAGISLETAVKLCDVGVTYIDVAGAGGTSWAGVEILRRKKSEQQKWNPFWDWGIATADALTAVVPIKKQFPDLKIISSGGIANGIECAKSIALGADLTASARPLLKILMNSGKKELHETILQWIAECKGCMFLTGISSLKELRLTQRIQRIRQ